MYVGNKSDILNSASLEANAQKVHEKSDLDTTIDGVAKISISSQPNEVSNEGREEKTFVSSYNSNPTSLTQEIKNQFEQIIIDFEKVLPAYEEFNRICTEILKENPSLESKILTTNIRGHEKTNGGYFIEITYKLLASLQNWSALTAKVAKEKLSNDKHSSKSETSNSLRNTSMKLTTLIGASFTFFPAFKRLFKNSDRFEDLNNALITLLNCNAKPLSQVHELVVHYRSIFPYINEQFINDFKGADIVIALLPMFIGNCTDDELTALSSLILSEKSRSYLSDESIQSFNTMISNARNSLSSNSLKNSVK